MIDQSKGGWATKILAITDALSNLVSFELLAGNRYDTVGVTPLIHGLKFEALLADKAFDANWIIDDMNACGTESVQNDSILCKMMKKCTNADILIEVIEVALVICFIKFLTA